jgi:hypothetical protein
MNEITRLEETQNSNNLTIGEGVSLDQHHIYVCRLVE